MGLVLAIIVLALLFGVIGFVVSALKWLLIIAVLLFLFGLFRGAAETRRR